MQDVKMMNQVAGHENARPEAKNAGHETTTSCVCTTDNTKKDYYLLVNFCISFRTTLNCLANC